MIWEMNQEAADGNRWSVGNVRDVFSLEDSEVEPLIQDFQPVGSDSDA